MILNEDNLTPAQEEFFKNSKVRDKKGNLLVCYHGANKPGFNEFNPALAQSQFGKYKFNNYNVNYFTSNRKNATSFTDIGYEHDNNVYSCYLNIENPFIVSDSSIDNIKTSFNIKDSTLRKKQAQIFDTFWDKFYLNHDDSMIPEINKYLYKLNFKIKPSSERKFDNGYSKKDGYYDVYTLGNNGYWGAEHPVLYSYTLDELFDDDMYDEMRQSIIGDEDDYKLSTDDVVRYVLAMNEEDDTNYDGIIIKDIIDSKDMFSEAATDFITLKSPNQIKLINNLNPTSSNRIDEKLSDYVPSNDFKYYSCGYILEDGSLLYMKQYHGEDEEVRDKYFYYPEFSDTHPEDDTCIRLSPIPLTREQFDRIEQIIDKYFDRHFYCKVECPGNNAVYGLCDDPELLSDLCYNYDSRDRLVCRENLSGYDVIKDIKKVIKLKGDAGTENINEVKSINEKKSVHLGEPIDIKHAKDFYNRGYIDLLFSNENGESIKVPAWHSKESQREISRELKKDKNGEDVEIVKGNKVDIEPFDSLYKNIKNNLGDNITITTVSPETNKKYSNTIMDDEVGEEFTGIGYKLFQVKNGKLYPPMIKNPELASTPIGKWVKCGAMEFIEVSDSWGKPKAYKSDLAYRPGWHLGEAPYAPQFESRTNKGYFSKPNFVWGECLYNAKVNYQVRANSYGFTQNGGFTNSAIGLPYRPENGFYKMRTNPNPNTIAWIITGEMKVNKILSDEEVKSICARMDVPYLKRPGGDKTLKELGINENLMEKIVKVGKKFQVQSKKGRNMGTYDTLEAAKERLKQVEMFKHMDERLHLDESSKLILNESDVSTDINLINQWKNATPAEKEGIKAEYLKNHKELDDIQDIISKWIDEEDSIDISNNSLLYFVRRYKWAQNRKVATIINNLKADGYIDELDIYGKGPEGANALIFNQSLFDQSAENIDDIVDWYDELNTRNGIINTLGRSKEESEKIIQDIFFTNKNKKKKTIRNRDDIRTKINMYTKPTSTSSRLKDELLTNANKIIKDKDNFIQQVQTKSKNVQTQYINALRDISDELEDNIQ